MTPKKKFSQHSTAIKTATWVVVGIASVLIGAFVVAVGFGLYRLLEWLVTL